MWNKKFYIDSIDLRTLKKKSRGKKGMSLPIYNKAVTVQQIVEYLEAEPADVCTVRFCLVARYCCYSEFKKTNLPK